MRQRYNSGTVWENDINYSRAIRHGNTIEVSGTTAVIDGEIVGIGDAYAQSRAILKKISHSLEQLGGNIDQVVRTRMYIVDIDDTDAVCRAHAETFAEAKPAATLVVVKELINPSLLVEIEATAIIDV